MTNLRSTLMLAALIALHADAANASLLIDQSQLTSNSAGSGQENVNFAPYGQTFTPTLAGLDFYTAYLSNTGSSAIVQSVNIYDTASPFTLLGTSQAVTIAAGFDGTSTGIEFDFASRVALTPGHQYVAVFSVANSAIFGAGTNAAGAYTGGYAVFNTGGGPMEQPPFESKFAEGVMVPEPATLVPSLVGISGMLMFRLRRNRKTVREV